MRVDRTEGKTMKVRIFLLRALLGWWIIPLATVFGFPIWYLMGGYQAAVCTLKFLKDQLWHGFESVL
jgi:hypothetical protein